MMQMCFEFDLIQNGSRLIGSLSEDIGELVASKGIYDLKGVGKGLGNAILIAVQEGEWPERWHEIHDKTPAGLIEMLGIPGVGPKRIKQLHEDAWSFKCFRIELRPSIMRLHHCQALVLKSGEAKILAGIDLLARARRRLNIGLHYGETFLELMAHTDHHKARVSRKCT